MAKTARARPGKSENPEEEDVHRLAPVAPQPRWRSPPPSPTQQQLSRCSAQVHAQSSAWPQRSSAAAAVVGRICAFDWSKEKKIFPCCCCCFPMILQGKLLDWSDEDLKQSREISLVSWVFNQVGCSTLQIQAKSFWFVWVLSSVSKICQVWCCDLLQLQTSSALIWLFAGDKLQLLRNQER